LRWLESLLGLSRSSAPVPVLLVAAEELRDSNGEQRMLGKEGTAPWQPTDRRAGTKPKAEFDAHGLGERHRREVHP
jgi:hypothetical protein